jgi:hypothetical protein
MQTYQWLIDSQVDVRNASILNKELAQESQFNGGTGLLARAVESKRPDTDRTSGFRAFATLRWSINDVRFTIVSVKSSKLPLSEKAYI